MNANALDTAAYISMTLAELKEACVAAGLPKTGPKEKLITFLKNPDLYRKKAARKRKASPAAEEPRESPAEAKELVDRAERPTRATADAAAGASALRCTPSANDTSESRLESTAVRLEARRICGHYAAAICSETTAWHAFSGALT